MYQHPLHISVDTLIGASGILGHRLEDRSLIRDAQDLELVKFVESKSTTTLRDESQKNLFCVAPLDVLVTHEGDRKQFHIIELNGTGIGGLTNISVDAVGCVLEGLSQMAKNLAESNPVIMVASSGLESEQLPRANKMVYEKILYAEALRRGFAERGQKTAISTVSQLREAPWEMQNDRPTVVLGYMKQFLLWLRPGDNGVLTLFDRPVDAAVNDRFCLNIVHEYPELDLNRFQTMNRCFLPGADKATMYSLLNEYLQKSPSPFTRSIPFGLAETRDELIEMVLDWRKKNRRVVIKPQGTGLGHGIEFFLQDDESEQQIIGRIEGSLQLTERYYGLHGGALPYTVCEFLDTAIIERDNHPARGRKYELRIVVYRDGSNLKAFPSIVKISSEVYNPDQPTYLSLINNITASAVATQSAGFEHMMPLTHQDTLDLLDLRPEDLVDLSQLCTNVVRYVLDQVQDDPAKVGLPGEGSELAESSKT